MGNRNVLYRKWQVFMHKGIDYSICATRISLLLHICSLLYCSLFLDYFDFVSSVARKRMKSTIPRRTWRVKRLSHALIS